MVKKETVSSAEMYRCHHVTLTDRRKKERGRKQWDKVTRPGGDE